MSKKMETFIPQTEEMVLACWNDPELKLKEEFSNDLEAYKSWVHANWKGLVTLNGSGTCKKLSPAEQIKAKKEAQYV